MAKAIPKSLSFALGEYHERVDKVKKLMAEEGIDVLLVHHLPNICYLSGYQTLYLDSHTCLILPLEGEPGLLFWESEAANADLTSWVETRFGYPTRGDPIALTAHVLQDQGLGNSTVGVETSSRFLTVRDHACLRQSLPHATFVDGSNLVNAVKLIKSARELDWIRQAATITALGMHAAVDAVVVGATDNEVAAAAYKALIGGGSEFMAMDPVVSAGMRAGIHHCNYGRLTLRRGDTVLLEMGAVVHRYSAPLMRSVVLEDPPDRVKRMADACTGALNGIIATLAPGLPFHQVAAVGKKEIAKGGPHMEFHHTYGYSIGLGFPPTWADCPVSITEGDSTFLQPGMVFHHTMSLRDVGQYGIAFSETVAITENGCEVLTDFPRELCVK